MLAPDFRATCFSYLVADTAREIAVGTGVGSETAAGFDFAAASIIGAGLGTPIGCHFGPDFDIEAGPDTVVALAVDIVAVEIAAAAMAAVGIVAVEIAAVDIAEAGTAALEIAVTDWAVPGTAER